LVGRNERTVESAADELRRSVTAHTIAEDLSEPGAAHRVFDRVGALGVEVDCLINNAGLATTARFPNPIWQSKRA